MAAFSAPPPIPFTARTSKVYWVPGSRPSTVYEFEFCSVGALSGISVQPVVVGTEVPSA